ncbi:DUF6207 family protein [Streptomyces sp. 8L]|uniref:DUF6207 family protein n=1 Tax=Streptomyces sp. 8L TaxID=2877242 RepID=UPI001CD38AE2|nr:DUF6207 family protein [Streptomyces sp. 8L]
MHLTEPGLPVPDITTPDEETARAAIREPEQLRHTSGTAPMQHLPGQSRRRRPRIHQPAARRGHDARNSERETAPAKRGDLPGQHMRVVAKDRRPTAKDPVGLQPNNLPHGQ